jgi:TRAP-type C4-dicarboxylate transport system permease small subunit
MSAFIRLMDRVSTGCAVLAALLLALAALVITWSVIYRALGASTYWEIEFSVYMMVASLFLASPYTLLTKGHVGVDLLGHVLPRRFAVPLGIGIAVVGLLVCAYLAVAGGVLTIESFHKGETTESTWAPYKWPLFLTMPVGLALTALQYIAELARGRTAEGAAP